MVLNNKEGIKLTTKEMLEKLNTAEDSPFYEIYGMIDKNDFLAAIECIKNYFKCDDDTAKTVCMDFKIEFYDSFMKSIEDSWTPEEIARNNEKARELFVNQPKCPTCGSTNVKKIPAFFQVPAFPGGAYKQFRCKNCSYEW